ncbi:hypothetical protein ScPMuIL_013445 [Solemya velum]
MSFVIVADEASPLKRYMMRPYPGKRLTADQKVFNYRLSRARRAVENAFGILAQRWGIFQRRLNSFTISVELEAPGTCNHKLEIMLMMETLSSPQTSKEIVPETNTNLQRKKEHEKSATKPNKIAIPSATRPCKEHSFLTDVADVRSMEHGLLQLLDDFHSGKLQAFGGTSTFEKMDQIREQQERLARLHFELDMRQDTQRLDTDEARTTANENLSKLIDKLHSLSSSVQDLSRGDNTTQ